MGELDSTSDNSAPAAGTDAENPNQPIYLSMKTLCSWQRFKRITYRRDGC